MIVLVDPADARSITMAPQGGFTKLPGPALEDRERVWYSCGQCRGTSVSVHKASVYGPESVAAKMRWLRARSRQLRADLLRTQVELAQIAASFASWHGGSPALRECFWRTAARTYEMIRSRLEQPAFCGMEAEVAPKLEKLRTVLASPQCSSGDDQHAFITQWAVGSNGHKTEEEPTLLTRRELDVLRCIADGRVPSRLLQHSASPLRRHRATACM